MKVRFLRPAEEEYLEAHLRSITYYALFFPVIEVLTSVASVWPEDRALASAAHAPQASDGVEYLVGHVPQHVEDTQLMCCLRPDFCQ